MRVISYSTMYSNEKKEYTNKLASLLIDYFKERHEEETIANYNKAITMIDTLLLNKYLIYLVIDDDKNVLGFLIMSLSNQFGMTKTFLVVDYMYTVKEYRGTKVTRLLFITVGKCSNDLQLDVLGTTLEGSSNVHNSEIINGEHVGYLFRYRREDFENKYKKLMKGYR